MNKLTTIFFLLFSSLILLLSIRGFPGNPSSQELNSSRWTSDGPFELSPERGRFALLYSLVEDKSFAFSSDLGKFAEPDVAVLANGQYVSLFAPGLSFLTIPGYLVGKALGFSQIGAFAVISLIALMNAFLIRSIALKLGAENWAAILSALVFLFATPAFAYAVNYYQHHISLFLILLGLYLLMHFENDVVLVPVWFLYAFSFIVDYPNLFLALPVALFALGRIINFKKIKDGLTLDIRLFGVLTFVFLIPPLLFLLWFNSQSYGSAFQLSGTLPTVIDIRSNQLQANADPRLRDIGEIDTQSTDDVKSYLNEKTEDVEKTAIGFFSTRGLTNGFYIHLVSPDRGIIFYAPVVMLGFVGLILAYRQRNKYLPVLIAIMGLNFLLYSMWGDPWGGWAFGSRYLIPTYAILSIFLSLALSRLVQNGFFVVVFFALFSYSVLVNSAGAITSSKNPPQVEVLALEKLTKQEEKYTPDRNFELLSKNKSKSLVFTSFANQYMDAIFYHRLVSGLIILSGTLLLLTPWIAYSYKYK